MSAILQKSKSKTKRRQLHIELFTFDNFIEFVLNMCLLSITQGKDLKNWMAKNTLYVINNFTTVIQICYILSPVIQSIKANAQIEEVLYLEKMKGVGVREKYWRNGRERMRLETKLGVTWPTKAKLM